MCEAAREERPKELVLFNPGKTGETRGSFQLCSSFFVQSSRIKCFTNVLQKQAGEEQNYRMWRSGFLSPAIHVTQHRRRLPGEQCESVCH